MSASRGCELVLPVGDSFAMAAAVQEKADTLPVFRSLKKELLGMEPVIYVQFPLRQTGEVFLTWFEALRGHFLAYSPIEAERMKEMFLKVGEPGC